MNEKHHRLFGEFVVYEKLCGGPDPHMRAVVEMCRGLSPEEQIWRAGLYVGFYNVPSAEAFWKLHRTYPGASTVMNTMHEHWDGFKFRRERKSVALDGTHGQRMVEYCIGVAQTIEMLPAYRDASFEDLWHFAVSRPHVGRYAATKLCEIWHRIGLVNAECPDIRPHGGWSPRTAISMIYPNVCHDYESNSQEDIDEANELALELKSGFVNLSWFELEVLLCEYKTSYSTKRQYPGRSLDSEFSYEKDVSMYWANNVTEHMIVRQKLSPPWALGELQGWDPKERLKKLGRVVSTYGYTWSDAIYDYHATTDFANPVRKAVR